MSGINIFENMNCLSLTATAAFGGALIGTSYLIKSSMRYSGAPPGPKRIPIVGNIEFTPEDGASFNAALQELCKKYGPVMCMYIGSQPVVVISDYNMLTEAYVTRGIDFAGRPGSDLKRAYNPAYPDTKGIIDDNYCEEWKRQRNTALTILRSQGWGKSVIEERIQTESEALVEELIDKKGNAFCPGHLLGTSVANIICALLFGARFQYDSKQLQGLLLAIDELQEAFARSPGGDYIPLMKLTPIYWRTRGEAFKAGSQLVSFYRKKIQEARDKLEAGEEPNSFVMSYLAELGSVESTGSKIKEDWTIQLVSDFFLAGAETTASTLQWAMLYMANNQNVQEKVFREIDSKLKKGNKISLKDRENLPYTDATIMEVQRITPLLPISVPHNVLVDTNIGNYTIPKGAEVWANLYGIMQNPETFPEPKKFKPERFMNENLDSVSRHDQWVPFSLGQRRCLGEQLARQELFIFFTNIIRTFKILPPEGADNIEFKEVFKFILKPSDYEVRFIRR